MAYTQADLDMCDEHIAQGERHIALQERLLTRLLLRGLPTLAAERFLEVCNQTLVEHRAHRSLIIENIEGPLRARPISGGVSCPKVLDEPPPAFCLSAPAAEGI